MTWFFADYVLLSVAAIAGIIGLFMGFSGALAFLAAAVVSALAGRFGWAIVGEYFTTTWSCALATIILVLLVFGLVRWLVRKVVGGLLRQPADAIFGFLTAAVTGFGLGLIAIYLLKFFQLAEIQSTFVTEAMGFV